MNRKRPAAVWNGSPLRTMAFVTAPCLPAPSDEVLLERFAAGERAALEELFGRYKQPAYRAAFRLLGNEPDALDAVQEGFVKALTHLSGFQGRSSFKTWLLRVVSNAALDLGRQRGRRVLLSLNAPGADETADAQLLTPDEAASGLERADLRTLLDEALATLSEAQRQTFVLHADAGLSYREVADATGVSIGTVMSRLFYARQRLRGTPPRKKKKKKKKKKNRNLSVGIKKPTHHGADRHARGVGHFPITKAGVRVQHKRLPLGLRQSGHRLVEKGPEVGPFQAAGRLVRREQSGVGGFIGARSVEAQQHPPAVLSAEVEGGVADHPQQPGLERTASLKALRWVSALTKPSCTASSASGSLPSSRKAAR